MISDDEVGAGISPVAGPGRPRFTRRQLFIAIFALAVVALGFVVMWLNGTPKPEPHEEAGVVGPQLLFERPPEPRPAPVTHPMPMPTMAMPTPIQRSAPPVDSLALDSPMLSYRSSYAGAGGNSAPGAGTQLAQNDRDGGGADDELSKQLRSSNIGAAARAHVMHHPALTIPAGTVVPCTLQTAINSQLLGFVDCVLPEEVRGATGTVVLLDRGTQIFGEIRSGLRQGQDRVFVLWVRARTPQNVVVDLDSPGADELGRSGLPGVVDQHFWQRFGAALLFSVIEIGPQLASSAFQNNNGGGNNTNNYTQFLSPSQSLGGTILNQTIQIPPTLEKNQGDSVTIFVARDVDFSGVYDLQTQPPPP